jgi:hypothetical protein
VRTLKKSWGYSIAEFQNMTSSLLQLLDQKGRTLERMFAADIFLPGTVKDERDILEELFKCYPQNADLKLRISEQLYDLLYRCTCEATLQT